MEIVTIRINPILISFWKFDSVEYHRIGMIQGKDYEKGNNYKEKADLY